MLAILQRHPLITALSVLAVLLTLVIGLEAGLAASLRAALVAPVKRAAPVEAKLLPAPVIAQAEQLYPETAARPLFVPARRTAPAAAAPSTYTPGQFVLQGVIVVGNNRTALLREKSSGKIHRAEQGREINGIKVAEITPEGVVLTQGNEREVVPLQVLKLGATPAAPAAPATNSAGQIIGPFGPPPPTPQPGSPPGGVPQGGVPTPLPGSTGAPVPAPPGVFPAPATANPLAAPVPAPGASAPAEAVTGAAQAMTPEELLARRRARRGQQTQ
jgi:hypothetical protein